jgi:hypothetical protein
MTHSNSENPNPNENPQTPTREVIQADAIAWLQTADLGSGSIITSLPDASAFEAQGFGYWRAWFIEAVRLCLTKLSPQAVGIFYQTDIKRDGVWIDKGFLCQLGAEAAGAALLWHKVVCRAPAGQVTFNRPAYSHMLCFSQALRLEPGASTADVLPSTGLMTWAQAMGVDAASAAVRFVQSHTTSRTVIDPFCGHGTALAVANKYGLNAVGVDVSGKMCRRARRLTLEQ